MRRRGLGDARALFRARRFAEVIRLLEPEVFRYRENIEYFRLLGFACLHAGDLGGGFSYISRAHQLKDDDVDLKLGLAAIHFRRAENDSALKKWLEVLELQPSHRIARRGLELLRRGLTPDALQEMIDSGKLRLLYPPLPARVPLSRFLVVLLSVMIIAGIGYLAYRASGTIARGQERPGIAGIEIPPDVSLLIEPQSGASIVLTEKDVRQAFQRAKADLLAFRDNAAAVGINRLLLSNAVPAIKERARLLKGFVTQASFDTLRDSYPYSVVMAQPALYDGCSVRWKGKIANLSTGKDSITFDLLVGYDQEKELQGIVPVTLSFAVGLEDGAALEVLGQVIAKDKGLSLTGIALHRLTAP